MRQATTRMRQVRLRGHSLCVAIGALGLSLAPGACAIGPEKVVLDDGEEGVGGESFSNQQGTGARTTREFDDSMGGAAAACRKGERKCTSNRELATCEAALDWVTEECTYACVDDRCTGECVPRTAQCRDDDGAEAEIGPTLATCNDEGQWRETPCEHVCVDGECEGKCTPGAGRCKDGAPQVCDDEGHWKAADACAKGQSCVREGECLAPPILATFTADKYQVLPDESVLLQWTYGEEGGAAESITLTPGGASGEGERISPAAASYDFTPPRSNRYTLTVANAAGSSERSLNLTIVPEGVFDRVHTFGLSANRRKIDVSPGGRIVTLAKAVGHFEVGPVDVTGKYYLAEHDIDRGEVLLAGIPEHVHEAEDFVFDGEDVIVVGASNGQTPESAIAKSVVERLDENFESNDHFSFALDSNPQRTIRVAINQPTGNILVLGYSTLAFFTGLVELDRDLELTHDLDDAATTAGGYHWSDFAVTPQGRIAGLQPYPTPRIDYLESFPNPEYRLPITAWQVLSVESGSGEYLPIPEGLLALPDNQFVVYGNAKEPSSVPQKGYIGRFIDPTSIIGAKEYLLEADDALWIDEGIDEFDMVDGCVNDAGEVILVSTVTKGEDQDIFVIAFVPEHQQVLNYKWHTLWGEEGTNEFASSVACDPRGHVLVLGGQASPGWEDNTSFIARFK